MLEDILSIAYKKKKKNLFTFLTGAGLSSDSGIPTYRGSDGIWIKGTANYKPEEFGTLRYFLQNPEEVWIYTLSRIQSFRNAEPNAGHIAIAEIEALLGNRFQLITQNIDNLHEKAGSKNIYEIHGHLREVKCSKGCKGVFPINESTLKNNNSDKLSDEIKELLKCPTCGGWLRPNVLLFDETYDEITNKYFSTLRSAKETGILFITGTSGATNLPMQIAKTAISAGCYVVDININDSDFTDLLKDKKRAVIIRESTSTALPAIKTSIENCIH
jgi:NAD-dependent deacetylase